MCHEHQKGHHEVETGVCILCRPLKKYGKAKKQSKPRPVPVALPERQQELEPEKVMCWCGKAATDWTEPDYPLCGKHAERQRKVRLVAKQEEEVDYTVGHHYCTCCTAVILNNSCGHFTVKEDSDDDSEEEEEVDEDERRRRSDERLEEAGSHPEACKCDECLHTRRCDCDYCVEDCAYERVNPDADGDGLCDCTTCEDTDNCSAEHTCCQVCDAGRKPGSEEEEDMKEAPASPSYSPNSPVAQEDKEEDKPTVTPSKVKDLVLQLSVYAQQEMKKKYGVNWTGSYIDEWSYEERGEGTRYENIICWANQIKKEKRA